MGSTTTNLQLTGLTLSESGTYSVVVHNSYGSTNSSATLAVYLTNPPTLSALKIQTGGAASGVVKGLAGRATIEASTDLLYWVNLTNIILTNLTAPFTDPSATNYSQRFYRVRVE